MNYKDIEDDVVYITILTAFSTDEDIEELKKTFPYESEWNKSESQRTFFRDEKLAQIYTEASNATTDKEHLEVIKKLNKRTAELESNCSTNQMEEII